MYLSKYFFKSKRKVPSIASETNYEKMVRASMIFKNSSGFYSYLPLGFRILKKLEQFISQEMQKINFHPIQIPFLIPDEILKKSRRLEAFGKNIFYTKDYKNRLFILGATYEESIALIFKSFVHSYRDFPIQVFQIGTKFRNELRSKFGLIRTIEFTMKDAYSLHLSEQNSLEVYQMMKEAYQKIFQFFGLDIKIVKGDSGIMGGSFSEEYMFPSSLGEDYILICKLCGHSENIATIEFQEESEQKERKLEKLKKNYECQRCEAKYIDIKQVLELGHIFQLGTKYAQAENFYCLNQESRKIYPIMNSYGIGITRLLLTIINHASNQEDKIVLPFHLSPFHVIVIPLDISDKKVYEVSTSLYKKLDGRILSTNFNLSVLIDDRNLGPSIKFKDADLMGIPIHIIIGQRELESEEVEIKLTLQELKKKLPINKVEVMIEELCKQYLTI